MSNKKREIVLPKAGLYLIVIFILATVVLFFEPVASLFFYIVGLGLLGYDIWVTSRREKELTGFIEDLSLNISNATNGTMRDFPLPLSVIQLDGKIIWYNPFFKKMLPGEKLFDRNIDDLIPMISPQELLKKRSNLNTEVKNVEINGKVYDAHGTIVKTERKSSLDDYILILYFLEKTELVAMEKKYHDEQTAIGIIMIDNYDEMMQNIDEYQRSQFLAELEGNLNNWLSSCSGVLKKYERDKYFFMFESKYMEWLVEKKFEILDMIRSLPSDSGYPITISIGFGINCGDIKQNYEAARVSIDVALGRGGDQVVVQDNGKYRFYGGKTREIEKRTKVKSRVVTGVLKGLISNASGVIIMGHETGDLDSLGASVGMGKLTVLCGKAPKIVIGKITRSISGLYNELLKEEEYKHMFISSDEAVAAANADTLLIVVDVHKPGLTECPALLDICKKIVVIDHHRRGADFIRDMTISYQEPYASSTCELVTEILSYSENRLHMTKLQAEALYAGMVMDTKNFTFKTGTRTFEAAAYLKQFGVDTARVKNYSSQDLEMYLYLSEVIKTARILDNGIAVAAYRSEVEDYQLTAATAADQLVNLTGIIAAFVLVEHENNIHISGRSYGEVNVQMVLEKMGGGGHQTVAGAQIKGMNPDEAKKMLIDILEGE